MAIVGYIICFVGSIMLLIHAFRKSVGWGLASLFIPFVLLVFTFMNWDDCKKGFLVSMAGIVILVVGGIMVGDAAANAVTG